MSYYFFHGAKCLRDGFYLQLVAPNQGYKYTDSKVAVGTAKQKHEVGSVGIKCRDYSKGEKTGCRLSGHLERHG